MNFKKYAFPFLFLLAPLMPVAAQNVQLHYDFGRSLYDKDLKARPLLTTTVEMFKPDSWGSTFFFVDMDYTSEGVDCAYWEIARELTFWKAPVSLHVEYNGGLNYIRNAYLGGLTYAWHNAAYSRTFALSALYKYIQKHEEPHNFQLTGTWQMQFRHGQYTLSGFADFWREKNLHGDYIFLAEPQFWVNLNRFEKVDDRIKLSVGTEVELSHNFGGRNGFYAIPTLALKWSFD